MGLTEVTENKFVLSLPTTAKQLGKTELREWLHGKLFGKIIYVPRAYLEETLLSKVTPIEFDPESEAITMFKNSYDCFRDLLKIFEKICINDEVSDYNRERIEHLTESNDADLYIELLRNDPQWRLVRLIEFVYHATNTYNKCTPEEFVLGHSSLIKILCSKFSLFNYDTNYGVWQYDYKVMCIRPHNNNQFLYVWVPQTNQLQYVMTVGKALKSPRALLRSMFRKH